MSRVAEGAQKQTDQLDVVVEYETSIVVDLGHQSPALEAVVVSFYQNHGPYLYPCYGRIHPRPFSNRTVSCLPAYRGHTHCDSHPRAFYPNLRNPFYTRLVCVHQMSHKNHHKMDHEHGDLRMIEGCRRRLWKDGRNVGTGLEVPLGLGGPRCDGLLQAEWE